MAGLSTFLKIEVLEGHWPTLEEEAAGAADIASVREIKGLK